MADDGTERWDPISKQPMFKSGAVRIERIESSSEGPHVREQHTAAVERATHKDAPLTAHGESQTNRERKLELWLGETYETLVQLLRIYDDLLPRLIHDAEVDAGLRILRRIAEDARSRLEPHAARLGGNRQRGRHRAHVLREALFPPDDAHESAYEVLEALQGLGVYLAHIESSVVALTPAAQAMWDGEFVGAVEHVSGCLARMKAWVGHQVGVRSPQTLLVPVRVE